MIEEEQAIVNIQTLTLKILLFIIQNYLSKSKGGDYWIFI